MVLPHSIFQTVSEQVFSETRTQPVASLSNRTGAERPLQAITCTCSQLLATNPEAGWMNMHPLVCWFCTGPVSLADWAVTEK